MILDPDYARIFTQARIIAWQYGFAVMAHGSYTRDLDILLVPWEPRAADVVAEQIIRMIADACDLSIHGLESPLDRSKPMDFTLKAHGRKAYTLHLPGAKDRRWVDLSVMPCRAAPLQAVEGETDG